MIDVVDLTRRLARCGAHRQPKIVGELNDAYVTLAKLQGETIWHRHAVEDELLLVVKGSLLIRLRDRDMTVGAGDFVVTPRGVQHLPIAHEEMHRVVLELKGMVNTGWL